MYGIINQEFHYQFLRLLWLWTLKTGMEDGKYQQYGAIEFLPFAQVSSHEHFEWLWGSYLDFPRGGSRAAATSKMEHFVIIVNGLQSLTNITKRSILNVAAALISASASPASWVTYNEDVLPMYWHTGMYFSEYKIWESLKHSLK